MNPGSERGCPCLPLHKPGERWRLEASCAMGITPGGHGKPFMTPPWHSLCLQKSYHTCPSTTSLPWGSIRVEQKCNMHGAFSWGDPLAALAAATLEIQRAGGQQAPIRVFQREVWKVWPKTHEHISNQCHFAVMFESTAVPVRCGVEWKRENNHIKA